ncbi:MAG: phosphomannomutase/phosphoglucomutase [Deltaproteobacteria bacterium]|nr:phosphomannomutase/phosphoglucomutase [Deltaproteobacteria bacterium]
MKYPPHIFREYDIRGVVGKELTSELAFDLGRGLGEILRERKLPLRAVVGGDARLSSTEFKKQITQGLQSVNADVYDIGRCPTPLLYFGLFNLEVGGGIMVTGSHNPPEFNGFKICVGKESFYGKEIQGLRDRLEGFKELKVGRGKIQPVDLTTKYLEFLAKDFKRLIQKSRPLKVVIDCGNGVAGLLAPQALKLLKCDLIELYTEPDGRFPNHHPDPTIEENLRDLREKVIQEKADVGIGFDGDADRIGVVDERGEVIWGDRLLLIYARDLLERKPGATIISEVKCSQQLFDDIEARGGRAMMWKAGHSLMKAKMKETKAELGGEMSGHMFFADRFFGYDDAIYAACRLVEILVEGKRPISQLLSDLKPLSCTPEIRIDCPDDLKFKVVSKVRERFSKEYPIIDIDGVRVVFENGWALLRASNTQPALVMRVEAETPEALAKIQANISENVREFMRF